MCIQVRLFKVEPDQYDWPTVCPGETFDGQHLKPHGVKGVKKPIRDPQYAEVRAYWYKCLKCKRTFRTYPLRASKDQQSDRLKPISVLLYVLGLNYGAVEDFLEAMGMAIAMVSRQGQSEPVAFGGPRRVIGSDGTYVKVRGERVAVQVVVDDKDSDLLGLEIVVSENAEDVKEVVEHVARQMGAEVLVSDAHCYTQPCSSPTVRQWVIWRNSVATTSPGSESPSETRADQLYSRGSHSV